MADVHEPKVRSYNMSRIRSKDTKPEMVVRKLLHSEGFRYRLHDKRFPGKPDIVLPKYKSVIFVNGCFWHGHEGCSRFVLPKSRQEYWIPKIKKNISRMESNKSSLRKMGWKVIVVWECEIKTQQINKTKTRLFNSLLSLS